MSAVGAVIALNWQRNYFQVTSPVLRNVFLTKDGKNFHSNKAAIVTCVKPAGREVTNLPGEFDSYIVDLFVDIRSKASVIQNEVYTYRQFIMLVLDSSL